MAARSVEIIISNWFSNTKLLLVGSGLSHGEWSENAQPPKVVGRLDPAAVFQSESDGVATGTQGWVRYYPVRLNESSTPPPPSNIPDSATIYISWDNPFADSNSYSVSAPAPFLITYSGGEGDNADIIVNLGNVLDDGQAVINGPPSCVEGYVLREAFLGDYVCVLPATRAQAAADNAAAGSRIKADGFCDQGFVWRDAGPNDHVCVTEETRAQAAADNAAQAKRTL
jgi:hypothetical protein